MTDTVPAKPTDVSAESAAKSSDSKTTNLETTDAEATSVYNYVFIAVLCVVLLLLLYYAYCRFAENSVEEPMVAGQKQERDDPIIDFNLREAIKELQTLQRNIMSTISDNSDI